MVTISVDQKSGHSLAGVSPLGSHWDVLKVTAGIQVRVGKALGPS